MAHFSVRNTSARLFVQIILSSAIFSIYNVVSLYVTNITQAPMYVVSRVLVVNLGVWAALNVLALLLTRSLLRGASLALVWMVLFNTYGYLFDLVDGVQVFGVIIGRNLVMLAVWLGLAVAAALFFMRRALKISPLIGSIIWLPVLLLFISLGQLGWFVGQHGWQSLGLKAGGDAVQNLPADPEPASADLPDIYYILLDRYARPDALRELYGLDVSSFTDELKEMGFVIPACGISNYNNTIFSMPSILNMNYLDALGMDTSGKSDDDIVMLSGEGVKNNEVMHRLELLGYRTYTFESNYLWLEIPNSSVFYSFEDGVAFYDRAISLQFYRLYLRTSAFRPLHEWYEAHPEYFVRLPGWVSQFLDPTPVNRNFRRMIYENNRFMLDELPRIAAQSGPKFVYAHLMITHPPFVFNRDGSFRSTGGMDERSESYVDAIIYINSRLPQLAADIRAASKSGREPVIVFQADHGDNTRENAHRSFNAFYLPAEVRDKIPPAFSAVNTFRLIFSEILGKPMQLLEDRAMFDTKPWSDGVFKEVVVPCTD